MNNFKNVISVVCAADDNYAMPLAVMLRSAIENLNSQANLSIFVIDGGIKDANKHLILQSLEDRNQNIVWLYPDQTLYDWAVSIEHLSEAAYLRLMVTDLLPEYLEKIIYLDCDLIVNSDLKELWDVDVKNYHIAAVQSSGIPFVSSPRDLIRYSELNIPPDHKYFNSGVLVINLSRWRTDNISQKAIEYVRDFGDTLVYADQDVLNALLSFTWKELDDRWNQQVPFLSKPDSVKNAYIVHYISKHKPWNVPSRKDADELFLKYLAQTKWSKKVFWIRVKLKLIRQRRNMLKFLRRIKTNIMLQWQTPL